MVSAALVVLSFASICVHAQTYSATYLPSNAPSQSEQGQSGTNECGGGSSQNSSCQNAYLNSLEDWCIFAPPEPGPNSDIGDTERIEVAWCTQSGHGTRVIPDGAITGAHFVLTPNFVQVTGVGDLTLVNIPAGDSGGELDPHGADGLGNPIGGLVFSSAFGELAQLHEWTNFVSSSEFCFRGCKDAPDAPTWCEHIYDVMGCMWNMPANYDAGVFESCLGDSGEPMGVYGTSTFFQGEPSTPSAHPIPPSSDCTSIPTITNGFAASTTSTPSSTPTSSPTSSPPPSLTTPPASSESATSSTSVSAALTPSSTLPSSSGSVSASVSNTSSVSPSSTPSVPVSSNSVSVSQSSSQSGSTTSTTPSPSPTDGNTTSGATCSAFISRWALAGGLLITLGVVLGA